MPSSAEATVIQGDCVEVMREMPENSVDAVVCDPPYGINFMGKAWDGKHIAEAALRDKEKMGDNLGPMPSLDTAGVSPGRKKARTKSAYAGASNHAGSYDFSLAGNKAFQHWCETWCREAFRVMKPGAYILAFGGTRTSHRLACAIEDAGFEIRDTLTWIYGSGFPKSANIGKHLGKLYSDKHRAHGLMPTEGTETMKRYFGHGTAAKPAHEPIIMARKPLSESSVARNVLKHGTGAINVDGCRVGTESTVTRRSGGSGVHGVYVKDDRVFERQNPPGRWPPNLLLSHADGWQPTGERRRVKTNSHAQGKAAGQTIERKANVYGTYEGSTCSQHVDPDGYEEVEGWECVEGCPVLEMDRQSGNRKSGSRKPGVRKGMGYHGAAGDGGPEIVGNAGGASRFFPNFTPDTGAGFLYQAKASRRERNAGLEGMPEREHQTHNHVGRDMNKPTNAMGEGERKRVERGERAMRPSANTHPTVKPLALMDWLVTLITPPGGTVLDPFCGSGSTGANAVRLGFNFIGIEKEEEYAEIARRRIEYWSREAMPAVSLF